MYQSPQGYYKTKQLYFAHPLQLAWRVAQAHGVKSSSLLEGTGLPPSVLDDPYSQLSWQQDRQFHLNLLRAIDTQGLGLEVGRAFSISEPGPIGACFASVSAALDSPQALKRAQSMLCLNLAHYRIDDGDTAIHRLETEEPNPSLRQFMVDRLLAAIEHGNQQLNQGRRPPKQLKLAIPEPENSTLYKVQFRCPISFDQPCNELIYSSQEEVTTQSLAINNVVSNVLPRMEEAIARLKPSQDIQQSVKLALKGLRNEFPSLEEMAKTLGMSGRTLRRKLSAEGVRYQSLLDNERRRLACTSLIHTALSIEQIAGLCDFSDGKNFTAAFKRWTGFTPTGYRSRYKSH